MFRGQPRPLLLCDSANCQRQPERESFGLPSVPPVFQRPTGEKVNVAGFLMADAWHNGFMALAGGWLFARASAVGLSLLVVVEA